MKKLIGIALVAVMTLNILTTNIAFGAVYSAPEKSGKSIITDSTRAKKAVATRYIQVKREAASIAESFKTGINIGSPLEGEAYERGELLIKWAEPATAADINAPTPANDLVKNASLLSKWNLKLEKELIGGIGLYQITEKGMTVERKMKELNASSEVFFAQPNYNRAVLISATHSSTSFSSSQWGITGTRANEAWDITKGSPEVLVGVLDSGIDYRHNDLSANIYENPNEVDGDGVDNDNNGYIDDVHGYDFGEGDSYPLDNQEHGTHVSGIIAAMDNNTGVTGVAPNVKLLPLKISDSTEDNMPVSAELEAISYGLKMGVKVFNCSFGSFDSDVAELTAFKAADALFICAAGNGDVNTHLGVNTDRHPYYPASYNIENIISVAAYAEGDRLTSFSNYGAISVDIAAPGSRIYSTLPYDRYGNEDGTSMATPFVSGTAALILSIDPQISIEKVKEYILSTATTVSSFRGSLATDGKLNIFGAVSLAKEKIVPVTGVALDAKTLTLLEGEKGKLHAHLLPMEAHSDSFQWISSAPEIAAVDKSGNITGITKGIATITVTDPRSGFSTSATVTVKARVLPTLAPGKTLNMSFATPEFIDGEAKLWLIRPDGTETELPMSLNYSEQTYEARIIADRDGRITTSEVDSFRDYGVWEVELIEVTTAGGKIYTFYNEEYFDSTLQRATPMNFAGNKFFLYDNLHSLAELPKVNTNNSMNKTQMETITFEKAEVSSKTAYLGTREQLKIYGKARAGIYTAYIYFTKPDGTEVKQSAGVSARDGYYYCNMYVTELNGSGNNNIDGINDEGAWTVRRIQLYDSSYEVLDLYDRRTSKSPSAVDLSPLDFEVVNEKNPATELYFGSAALKTSLGKVIQPTLYYSPDEASMPSVTYSSSNTKVATVNKYGVVTPKKAGKTTITAKTTDGTGLKAKTVITVK